jgi:hypothetical protein
MSKNVLTALVVLVLSFPLWGLIAFLKKLRSPRVLTLPAKYALPEPPPKALFSFLPPPKVKPKRSTKKGEYLTPLEMEIMAEALCPDCGGQLYEGPEGGCAVMISCGGCPSTFLVGGGVGGAGQRTSDATTFEPDIDAKSYRDGGVPV